MGTVYAKARRSEARQTRKSTESSEDRSKVPYLDVPVRVDKVHIDGLMRTKDDIVKDSVRDVLKSKDFQELIERADAARSRLESIGCFKNIGVFIDTSSGPEATKYGYEVTFYVRELKRVMGGVNTMVGNNEGSLVVGMKFPNLYGRGERIQTEYSYGSKKSNNCSFQFVKPIRGRANGLITTGLYQAISEWASSGFKQVDRGFQFDFGFNSTPLVKHNLIWDAVIRDLSVLSRGTSFAVREQSGLSLKSAIRHVLSLDQRDDTVFPSIGTLVQITSELAGFGGDVGFLKNDMLVQMNYSVLPDIVFQASLQAGFIKAMSPDKKINLCDQFYLGGPLSLRGFQMRGIGPHSDGNALGSDIFVASALHLYTPLPFYPGQGGFGDLFRTHLFVNLGNVGKLNAENTKDTLAELSENLRVAYGIGIALRIGQVARVELNYCFPFSWQRGDQPNPGVQFGIGMQFL